MYGSKEEKQIELKEPRRKEKKTKRKGDNLEIKGSNLSVELPKSHPQYQSEQTVTLQHLVPQVELMVERNDKDLSNLHNS